MSGLKNNPLLVKEGLPRYDEIEPEHVVPGVKHVLSEAEKQIAALEQNMTPSWDGLLVPLEKLDVPFSYAWGPVGHLLSVKNSDDLREAHEAVLQDVVAFGLRVQQSRPIYEGLVAIRDGEEWAKLDEAQKRCIELKIRTAEHAGVGLEGAARERFNEIAKELSQISTDFSNHVLDATKDYELIIENKKDTEGLAEQFATSSRAILCTGQRRQRNNTGKWSLAYYTGFPQLLSLYATPSRTRPPRASVQSLCPARILWRMGQQRVDSAHLKIAQRAICTSGF